MRTLYFYRLSRDDQNTVRRWHLTLTGFYSALLLLLVAFVMTRAPTHQAGTFEASTAVPNLEALNKVADGTGRSAAAARPTDLQGRQIAR
ncbi:MAG: hypothetical protein ACXWJW_14705 [Xanthobacteraceae bacterium]